MFRNACTGKIVIALFAVVLAFTYTAALSGCDKVVEKIRKDKYYAYIDDWYEC